MQSRDAVVRRPAPILAVAAGLAVSVASHAGSSPQSVRWSSAASGDWFDPSNWDLGLSPNDGQPAPDDAYEAIIDAIGSDYVVTLASDATLTRLRLASANATLRHNGGALDILETFDVTSGRFELSGGTLRGGTLTIDPAATFLAIGSTNSIEGVTINGDFRVGDLGSQSSGALDVGAGVTINGTAIIGGRNSQGGANRGGGTLRFTDDHALAGSVLFDTTGNSTLGRMEIVGGRTLSVAASSTIAGAGAIGGAGGALEGRIVNDGLILANDSRPLIVETGVELESRGRLEAADGGWLRVEGRLDNSGVLASSGAGSLLEIDALRGSLGVVNVGAGGHVRIDDGVYVVDVAQTVTDGTLTLGGDWSATAGVSLVNAELNLGGSFTTSDIQVTRDASSILRLRDAALDNRGATLTLGAALGDLIVEDSVIDGGGVEVFAGQTLRIDGASSTIRDASINGDVLVRSSGATNVSTLRLEGDVGMGGTLTIGRRGGGDQEGSLVIDGLTDATGSIIFDTEGTSTLGTMFISDASLLRIAETGVMSGGGSVSRVGLYGGVIMNEGLIASDQDGFELLFNNGVEIVNSGRIQAVGGGDIEIFDRLENSGELRVVGAQSVLEAHDLRGSLGTAIIKGDGRLQIHEGDYVVDQAQTIDNGLLILGGTYDITSTIDVTTGAKLDLGGVWRNSGSINVESATLEIQGQVTTADLGLITVSGDGETLVSGSIDNRGAMLSLDPYNAFTMLGGGSVLGGSISSSSDATLTVRDRNASTDATLRDVHVTTDVFVGGVGSLSEARLVVEGATTFDAPVTIGRYDSSQPPSEYRAPGVVQFNDDHALTTTVRMETEGNATSAAIDIMEGRTLTINAPGVLSGLGDIRRLGLADARVVNHGLIEAGSQSAVMTFQSGVDLENHGTLRATGGGDLFIDRLFGDLGGAQVIGAGSRLVVDGGDFDATAAIDVLAGGRLDVRGLNGDVGPLLLFEDASATLQGAYELTTGVTVANRSTLELEGEWRNGGSITLIDAVLEAGGTFSTDDIGAISSIGTSRVELDGLLENSDRIFTLDATTPLWALSRGGEIVGGRIETFDGRSLEITDSGGGTIDGVLTDVLVSGSLLVGGTGTTGQGRLDVRGHTAFDGTVVIGRSSNVSGEAADRGRGVLRFSDDHALIGDIIFDTFGSSTLGSIELNEGSTLTIMNGRRISGAGSIEAIDDFEGFIDNRGTIAADADGLTLEIENGVSITNSGRLEASAGGELEVHDRIDNIGTLASSGEGSVLSLADLRGELGVVEATNGGHVRIDGGSYVNAAAQTLNGGMLTLGGTWRNDASISLNSAVLTLGGAFRTADIGTIIRSGDSRVVLSGDLDNRGDVFTIDAALGDIEATNGTITGGQVVVQSGQQFRIGPGDLRATDVAFDGELFVQAFGTTATTTLTVAGETSLNGALTLGRANNVSGSENDRGSGQLVVEDALLLTGDLIFSTDGDSTFGSVTLHDGATMHVAPDGAITGPGTLSRFGDAFATIENDGLISADSNLAEMRFNTGIEVVNRGMIESINGATLRIRGRLENSGELSVGAGSRLDIENLRGALGAIDLAPGGVIDVASGFYDVDVNQTISGGDLQLAGAYDITADIALDAGATLSLSGSWRNDGSISVLDGDLRLGGSFNTDEIGDVTTGASGRTMITGALGNWGETFLLDPTIGSVALADGGEIRGGTLTSSGGARLQVWDEGDAIDGRLRDVLVQSDVFVGASGSLAETVLAVAGSTSLEGTVTLGRANNDPDPAADRGAGVLLFENDHRLLGEVAFDDVGDSTAPQIRLASGRTLTVDADAMIAGAGTFAQSGAADGIVRNFGVIRSDAAALTMSFNGGVEVENIGTLEAAAGGRLTFGDRLTNEGLLRARGDGSLVELPEQSRFENSGEMRAVAGGVISFGAFETAALGDMVASGGAFRLTGDLMNHDDALEVTGAGAFELSSGAIRGGEVNFPSGLVVRTATSTSNTLDGVVVNADVTVSGSTNLTLFNNTALNGTTTVESSGDLFVAGANAATVNGTIAMADASDLRLQSESTLTVASGALIRGGDALIQRNGGAFANLVNAGVISADQAGATLTMSSLDVFNSGVLEARNGGTLALSSVTLMNNAGDIFADAGSTVSITSSTISGGVFSPSGSGSVVLNGTSLDGVNLTGGETRVAGGVLTDITNDGVIVATSSSDTRLVGVITNNGTLTFEGSSSADFAVDGTAGAPATTTLTGVGEMLFVPTGGSTLNGAGAAASTLVNDVDHTLNGAGSINSMTIDNRGVIRARNGTLTLNSVTLADNAGGIAAGAGATLTFNSCIIDGGVITPTGAGDVQFSSTSVTGATFGGAGESIFLGGSLTDIVNNGVIIAGSSSDTMLDGTITNNGTLTYLGGGSDDFGVAASTVTLNGDGDMVLTSGDALNGFGVGASTLIHEASHLIRGAGSISSMTIDNRGGVIAEGGMLNVGSVTLNNTGEIRARSGATLSTSGGSFDNQGLVVAESGGVVTIGANANNIGGALSGGTWLVEANGAINLSGGAITTNAADVELSGAGSTFDALNAIATNSGRFALTDGRAFATLGGMMTDGEIAIDAASSLTVTGDLVASDGAVFTLELGLAPTRAATNGPAPLTNAMTTIGAAKRGMTALIDVSGAATLDGVLDLTLLSGFNPAAGYERTLFTYASFTGAFDDVLFPTLQTPDLAWYFEARAGEFVVGVMTSASRVPGSSTLAALGLAGVLTGRRRRAL